MNYLHLGPSESRDSPTRVCSSQGMSWEDFLDQQLPTEEILIEDGRRNKELHTNKGDICINQISRNYKQQS